MKTKQFEDTNLAHYSYAIVSNGEIALIDPARNPQPYYDYAKAENAKIVAVIETHPHADFVSSHLEIHKTTGATIYVSRLLGAEYAHHSFDENDEIKLGHSTLKALNTPGHSPDSISIVAINEAGKEEAVYTGDTLFIGDCGRPDLRESAGAITAKREELAKSMYHSLRDKLMPLSDDVSVFPAHGSGSLCGKGLSSKNISTIGEEKTENWSLQEMTEDKFIAELLADQPFIPKYFTFDVALNKKGAADYLPSIEAVEKREPITCESCANTLNPNIAIVDTRPQEQFKKSHIKNAVNLMDDTRFETWLGSVINPKEPFYLLAKDDETLNILITRIAKIGYESQIVLAFKTEYGINSTPIFDPLKLFTNSNDYTIVDIRNDSEVKEGKIFEDAIHIPLHQLPDRTNELPTHKPIVVHCAGGYRSAAGSSIIQSKINNDTVVYDLSEAVKNFPHAKTACKI